MTISEQEIIQRVSNTYKDGYRCEYVSGYVNTKTKCKFKCYCGNIFERTPASVIKQKQIYCKQCSIKFKSKKSTLPKEKMLEKLNKATNNQKLCKYVSGYNGMEKKCTFECNCGKQFLRKPNNVISGKQVTCGHCNDPKVEDKIHHLTIKKVIPNERGGSCSVETQCDCGGVWKGQWSTIKSGNTKTCGYCKLPSINDKYNMLTIIKVMPYQNGGCSVLCRCDCGKIIGPVVFNRIRTSRTKSCGNCKNLINGKPKSYPQEELSNIINNLLKQNGLLNHTLEYIGNVDIFYPKENLVIEYNGYYWHQNREKSDKNKYKQIRKENYKLLIIKAGGYNKKDIPTKKQLEKVLFNDFKHRQNQKTIILKTWYKSKKHQQNHTQNNCTPVKYWSRKDDEWLIENYITATWDKIFKNIPNRTKSSIQSRYNKKIRKRCCIPNNIRKNGWYQWQTNYLIKNIDKSNKELAEKLNKTVSSIYSKKLELRKSHNPT